MKAEAWLSVPNTGEDGIAATLADDHHNLALAVLVLGKAPVAAVFFLVGSLVLWRLRHNTGPSRCTVTTTISSSAWSQCVSTIDAL
jgi:hypothetical protein